MKNRIGLVLIALLSCTACEPGGGGSASTLTSPPASTWKGGSVTFSGIATRGNVYLHDLGLDIHFSDLPDGATFAVNGTTVAPNAGAVTTKIDLRDRIGDLAPKDAFDATYKLDPQVKIEIGFNPNVKVMIDVPPQNVSFSLEKSFDGAIDTPLKFANATPPSEHSILATMEIAGEVLGPAAKVRDVDWAAHVDKLPPRKGKTCDGYKKASEKDGPGKSYPLQMIDHKVTVYEVTTSKPIASMEFKAAEECPMFASGETANNYPSSDDEKMWLRQVRTRRE